MGAGASQVTQDPPASEARGEDDVQEVPATAIDTQDELGSEPEGTAQTQPEQLGAAQEAADGEEPHAIGSLEHPEQDMDIAVDEDGVSCFSEDAQPLAGATETREAEISELLEQVMDAASMEQACNGVEPTPEQDHSDPQRAAQVPELQGAPGSGVREDSDMETRVDPDSPDESMEAQATQLDDHDSEPDNREPGNAETAQVFPAAAAVMDHPASPVALAEATARPDLLVLPAAESVVDDTEAAQGLQISPRAPRPSPPSPCSPSSPKPKCLLACFSPMTPVRQSKKRAEARFRLAFDRFVEAGASPNRAAAEALLAVAGRATKAIAVLGSPKKPQVRPKAKRVPGGKAKNLNRVLELPVVEKAEVVPLFDLFAQQAPMPESGRCRPTRMRTSPLEHWRNERVVYQREEGSRCPTPVAVVVQPKSTPGKTPKTSRAATPEPTPSKASSKRSRAESPGGSPAAVTPAGLITKTPGSTPKGRAPRERAKEAKELKAKAKEAQEALAKEVHQATEAKDGKEAKAKAKAAAKVEAKESKGKSKAKAKELHIAEEAAVMESSEVDDAPPEPAVKRGRAAIVVPRSSQPEASAFPNWVPLALPKVRKAGEPREPRAAPDWASELGPSRSTAQPQTFSSPWGSSSFSAPQYSTLPVATPQISAAPTVSRVPAFPSAPAVTKGRSSRASATPTLAGRSPSARAAVESVPPAKPAAHKAPAPAARPAPAKESKPKGSREKEPKEPKEPRDTRKETSKERGGRSAKAKAAARSPAKVEPKVEPKIASGPLTLLATVERLRGQARPLNRSPPSNQSSLDSLAARAAAAMRENGAVRRESSRSSTRF